MFKKRFIFTILFIEYIISVIFNSYLICDFYLFRYNHNFADTFNFSILALCGILAYSGLNYMYNDENDGAYNPDKYTVMLLMFSVLQGLPILCCIIEIISSHI